MKYSGFPLPELEIIYPICVRGCRKIRDAEYLEDIGYHDLRSFSTSSGQTGQKGSSSSITASMYRKCTKCKNNVLLISSIKNEKHLKNEQKVGMLL